MNERPRGPVQAGLTLSTQEWRYFGPIDAIAYQLIAETLKDPGWFKFGISTANLGRELNIGLSRQKEMFGARTTVYQQYLVPLLPLT